MTFIPEAEQTSKGPVGIGTTFKGTNHLMGRTMQWTAQATEYVKNRKFGKNITSGSVFIEQHNTYNPTKDGVEIYHRIRYESAWIPEAVCPLLIVSSMHKELKKSLGNVKQMLETSVQV